MITRQLKLPLILWVRKSQHDEYEFRICGKIDRPAFSLRASYYIFGDDAFGVEVAQRLLNRPMPAGCGFGIRSFDLAYALFDSYDVAILWMPLRAACSGTLYVIQLTSSP